jgi:Peptidase M61 N-terminal domain
MSHAREYEMRGPNGDRAYDESREGCVNPPCSSDPSVVATYEISNFVRWVDGFEAMTEEGKPLLSDKLDYDTWRIRPAGAKSVRVSFKYHADSLDNAMSWAKPDFLLFNGTNLFLYPEGNSLDFAATVALDTEADYRSPRSTRDTSRAGAVPVGYHVADAGAPRSKGARSATGCSHPAGRERRRRGERSRRGSAAAAGVKPGDYLISDGDIVVEDQQFGAKLRAKYGAMPEGTPLTIKVRRGTDTVSLAGKLQFGPGDTVVEAKPSASPKAMRIREGILKGAVDQ